MTGIAQAPPRMGEIAGRAVALDFGDVAREYGALRTGAMLVDRSHRGRIRFTGDKAKETITGLVTNDVLSLSAGEGCYACALTAKGKIVSDLRAFATADGVLVDVPPRATAGFREIVRKYVNPRAVKYADADTELAQLGVFGITSRRIVSSVFGIAEDTLEAARPYAHVTSASGVMIVRSPELGLPGYELFIPGGTLPTVSNELTRAGATLAGLDAWEIARVEAGRPEWGIDIDDSTLAQEANMDEMHAVSYTKGCYTGQETVARVHFRGHVNRHLRAIRHRHPDPIPTGSDLVDPNGKVVGEIRSAVISPRLGAIAMGMVRHEVELPSALTTLVDGQKVDVEVYALPFPL